METIFKANAQAKAKSATETVRRNVLLALKERLCWLDIQVEILWEHLVALDISHRLTALLCCVQTNGSMATDRLGALSWEPRSL